MKFTKMQGAGNDFVFVESDDAGLDWSQPAAAICDRHFGIGADGLVLVMPSKTADLRMRIFNADGSEADACGNGLRCLVKYAVDAGLVKAGDISIETMAGVRKACVSGNDNKLKIEVGMGPPYLGTDDINTGIKPEEGRLIGTEPALSCAVIVDSTELIVNPVSMGNPHAVHFIDTPVADFPLSRLGSLVEHHPIFPKRVNFEIVRILDRENVESRVWERGVGETLACGSGACAIGVASRLNGFTGDGIAVKVPGGTLEVKWDGQGEVWLSGPAETVFTGEWTGINK